VQVGPLQSEYLRNPHSRRQRNQYDQPQTGKRFIDSLTCLADHLFIEGLFQARHFVSRKVALPLIIEPLHLHLIRGIPVYPGFLRPDDRRLRHHVVHDIEMPHGRAGRQPLRRRQIPIPLCNSISVNFPNE